MAKTVFEVLREGFESEIVRVRGHLAEGKASDFATYKELCGVIRGLTHALSAVADLEQNYMDDNND